MKMASFRQLGSAAREDGRQKLFSVRDSGRYTPEFLDVLKLKAAPAAQAVLDAIDVLREMNLTGARKVPEDATVAFIKARWKPLVINSEGIDRRFYEICALSELKNSLRSGDIWVQDSRQFRDFEEYLLPPAKFNELRQARTLPIAINPDLDQYLLERVMLLNEQLATVNRLALANELPDGMAKRRYIVARRVPARQCKSMPAPLP